MKSKHIVVLAENYPAPGRQMLIFVQELVHSLIDLGVKVTVVAPQSVVHSILHKQKLLPKHSVRMTGCGILYDIYRPYTISAGNLKFFSKVVQWVNSIILKSFVKKIRPEILYSHFWSSALPIYKFAAVNSIPLFVACGEGDDALEDMMNDYTQEEIKELASSVTGVISVSSENKRKCVDFGLCMEHKIEVLPNCVNTSLFYRKNVDYLKYKLGIKDDDFVVGFVGGFIPRKGPDRVAKAISIINDPKIKAIFIGKSFPGYPYDFDCPGIVHKGPLDHELLPAYLNCMDVFVMPTQMEGCCNAIVEALAIGLPVISSDGAFNDDILNESNSIRVSPDNIEAIKNAIVTLKENTKLRKEMMSYSLSRSNEYSILRRANKIIEFISKQI